MWQQLRQFNELGFEFASAEKQHRAELLMKLSLGIIVFSAMLLAVLLFAEFALTSTVGWEISAAILAVGVSMFIVRYQVREGRQQTAAFIFVGVLAGTYVLAFLANPSAVNPVLVGFLTPIIITAVMIGPRTMISAAMLLGGIVVLVILVEIAADSVPAISDRTRFAVALVQIFSTSLLMGGIVVYQYVVSSDRYIRAYHQSQQQMRRLSQISHYLRTIPDAPLQKSVELIRDEYNYQVRLFMRDLEGKRFISVAGTGLAGHRMTSELQTINVQGGSTAALAIRRGSPVRTTLEAPLPQREQFTLGTYVELAVPLLVDGQVTGVLVLQGEQEEMLRDHEIAMWETFVDELVLILQHQQLRQQLQEQNLQLNANRQQIDHYKYEVYQLTQELQGRVWQDYLKQHRERFHLQWKADMPVTSWESDNSALAQRASINTTAEGRQRLVVPIRLGETVLGEMVFEAPDQTQWTERTLDLATEVSTRLGLALDNVRLFDQAQTIAFREQTVGSIAAELQDARNIALLLDRAATIFNQVLATQQTHIRLGVVDAPTTSGQEG